MSEREWRFYLDDMIRFAENVLVYCEDLDQAAFETSSLNYDATVRNLELIDEAATYIPTEIQEAYDSIPWRQVIATSNRLIHGYLGIDNVILWSIIQDNIPVFLTELCYLSDHLKEQS